jgi:hypothetical protein
MNYNIFEKKNLVLKSPNETSLIKGNDLNTSIPSQ